MPARNGARRGARPKEIPLAADSLPVATITCAISMSSTSATAIRLPGQLVIGGSVSSRPSRPSTTRRHSRPLGTRVPGYTRPTGTPAIAATLARSPESHKLAGRRHKVWWRAHRGFQAEKSNGQGNKPAILIKGLPLTTPKKRGAEAPL